MYTTNKYQYQLLYVLNILQSIIKNNMKSSNYGDTQLCTPEIIKAEANENGGPNNVF